MPNWSARSGACRNLPTSSTCWIRSSSAAPPRAAASPTCHWRSASGGATLLCVLLWRRRGPRLPRYAYALPAALAAHVGLQYLRPSDADQWQQYNLPHSCWPARSAWPTGGQTGSPTAVGHPPDVAGLNQLDLSGTPLLAGGGRAQRLIVAMENPRRVYRRQPRRHQQQLPRSADAQAEWLGRTGDDHPGLRAAQPPDHPRPLRHALRRLDSGTPKGVELLNNPARARECLPAQLRQHGFSTHFLQGAGLRFMARTRSCRRWASTRPSGATGSATRPTWSFPGAWTTRPSSRAPRPT